MQQNDNIAFKKWQLRAESKPNQISNLKWMQI